MSAENGSALLADGWSDRTILLVDVHESTRLLELDTRGFVSRWRELIDRLETEILPETDGRIDKSLGDGVQLDFATAHAALTAARAFQELCRRFNDNLPHDQAIVPRMALDAGEVFADTRDAYGRAPMIAARILPMAGPGEIVASAGVADRLTNGLDADIEDLGEIEGEVEDLGEVYVKHLPTPVRLFRIGPCGPVPVLTGRIAVGTMLPTVAVIPFSGLGIEREHRILGEILADDVIHALSRTAELNVISRLSTTAFRDRPFPLDELASRLGAHYVLTGAYSVQGTALTLRVQLVDTASSLVVWSGRLHDAIGDLLAHEDSLTSEVVRRVGQTIMSREVERVRQAPLPTLDSYSLLLGAVGLLHRLSRRDFNDSRTLLEALIERARRQPLPHAWLAKWYVMQVQQGWSENPARDAELAHDCTKAALDADPDSSLALAMDGLVHTNLLRQLDVAGEQYARALELNPNDAQAWLLRGTMHAFKGEGTLAVEATERALTLSPYDPHKHYYDSLAATAQLAARRYDKALELARRSYRANRAHTSTLRVMASAQWKLGQRKAARETVDLLMRLEPSLTVSGWLARSPSADHPIGQEWAALLREVGVPA